MNSLLDYYLLGCLFGWFVTVWFQKPDCLVRNNKNISLTQFKTIPHCAAGKNVIIKRSIISKVIFIAEIKNKNLAAWYLAFW